MAQRLLNKVAIVTGASSGLGRAIARLYSKHGASIVCADLQPSARAQIQSETQVNTDALIRQDGGQALYVRTDVTDSRQMQELVSHAARAFGRVDIMVNNAGVLLESRTPAPVHQASDEMWLKTLDINTNSVFYGCKYAIRQMLEQKPHESGDRGWIVNLSSIFGVVATYNNPAYSASKGAVSNLTRQVALDYAKHRIHCNAICPGYTKTAIFAETIEHMESQNVLEEKHPLKGCGTVDDIAKAALVLASDDASWITGANLLVDGGYTAQ